MVFIVYCNKLKNIYNVFQGILNSLENYDIINLIVFIAQM